MRDHAYTDYEISKFRRFGTHLVTVKSVDSDGFAKIILSNDGTWMTVHENDLVPLTPFDIGLLKERPAMRQTYATQQAIEMERQIAILKEAIEHALDLAGQSGDMCKVLRRGATEANLTLSLED
jgi:hypothetical protein